MNDSYVDLKINKGKSLRSSDVFCTTMEIVSK